MAVDPGLLRRLAAAAARTAGVAHDGGAAWRDASIRDELAAALDDLDGDRVEVLAGAYDALLELEPRCTSDADETARQRISWVGTHRHARRRLGAFATPAAVADAMVLRVIGPDARTRRWPRVVDPACGAGALLVAALDRLVAAGVPPLEALGCLHGVDVDPTAVRLARARLVVRALRHNGSAPPTAAVDALGDIARRVVVGDSLLDEPEGWRAALADVLDDGSHAPDPVTGWTGGFDVVLANPPWERLKVTAGEHVGDASDLATVRRQVSQRVRRIREGGRHPLTGSGDLNAHLPFVETCWRLLRPGGRAAVLVPAGTLTDRQAGPLLEALLQEGSLLSAHGLDVRFDGLAVTMHAALLTLRRRSSPAPAAAEVIARVRRPEAPHLERRNAWSLTGSLVRTMNPSTGTAALFDSPRDAELVLRAHERFGVLLRREGGQVRDDPWGFRARTPVHLSREARHLHTAPGPGLVPLSEAKLAGLLDPRAATWDGARTRPPTGAELADPDWRPATRWWVPERLVRERYGDLLDRGWVGAYRIVSTRRTPRTLLPVPLPAAAYANSLALVEAPRLPLLLAALSSLPLDYVVRAKGGGSNLSLYKIEQLPVPPPAAYDEVWPSLGRSVGEWLLGRFAAAVRWCSGLAPLASELGEVMAPSSGDERRLALADLDAAHAHLLGWTVADLEHVLGTFTALRGREEAATGRFVTADRVLAAYDRLGPR